MLRPLARVNHAGAKPERPGNLRKGATMVLQHYTDRSGLEGIARTKSLWAINFMDLDDTSELIYGEVEMTKHALHSAWKVVEQRLKPEERRPVDFDAMDEQLQEIFRSLFAGGKPSEHMYVTSFARPQTTVQERLGLLTLWDRYTDRKGYCLEYDEREIRQLLEAEYRYFNYAFIDLAAVRYGIDESDDEFKQLNYQIKQHYLMQVIAARPALGIECDADDLWPMGQLATRMYAYCAKHKDSFFEDEREVRIFAVPGFGTASRPITGLARQKHTKITSDGKRYIDVGENMTPVGVQPVRIIVGPDASPNLDDILAQFERKPSIVSSRFPVRRRTVSAA